MNFLLTRLSKRFFFLIFLATICSNLRAQTSLVAGDIAFTGYIGHGTGPSTVDSFSFILLKNITANTVINFTDNGWLSTNVFRSGETTVTWTSNSALTAGQEITIYGTTAVLASGPGSAGTVTGTALSLSANGDQILAYQGSSASPTFISGIHSNVYSLSNPPDPVTTTAALWDGTANTLNSSALPPGLITGVNAIWIGIQDDINSEKDNARFICAGDLSTIANIKALIYDRTKWTTSDNEPVGFIIPTACTYIAAPPAPVITLDPLPATICEGANTSFTIAATGAISYQWQVDNGGGYTNIINDAIYSNATTVTLNISGATNAMNGYLYRCVATNGGGSTNSNSALLTVTALPVNPSLLAKTPATATVADGTPVSATFNPGSGGTGCSDDFRYTTNGGASYLPYTPGSNISTTGLAAGSGIVTIEGRRANCSSGCQGNYVALATWIVSPLPAAATTLNAGDIGFSAYAACNDEFSFVLLRNIGPGTSINFTSNGWLSTNVFGTGGETITWTSNAAYAAGTEIKISGLASTLQSGGSAGTVTGTPISLNINGDQVLAYRGTAAAPTFITAIHMNVYSISSGDAVNTTPAAWDGAVISVNASALPTGLTTGINCIWIGTQGVAASEFDNAKYGNCAHPATLGPISTLRAALNNQANWIKNNNSPTPGFAIPTGCNYLGIGTAPNITGQPVNATICEFSNASFTVTATGASTYQWQVDFGSGFNNITDNILYSGSTTATLTISAVPAFLSGNVYQCIVSNGTGSVTSASASLTVTGLPVNPTLAVKIPGGNIVADGTPVSATFNAGSGGTGCVDDYRYTIDGGITYLPYTPGSNISTTGLAAATGWVFIEGRRATCTAGCQGIYVVLASWYVTPLPASATTLNAGDIGFSGYTSTTAGSDFSFVLIRNVGPGTTINFTDNGWLSTNVFRTGETTVTWTAPAGGLPAGTEIMISGLTATRSGGGPAGTVTGTALALAQAGDQILAYRGSAASPTFISAIHMNVYSTLNADPVTTTAAAWDGTANTTSSSALPTGLTTGVNAIWIGTQDVVSSEFMNARYGSCTAIGVAGPFTGLRAALNNQANWLRNNNTPPGFTLPTACNYLNILVVCETITLSSAAGTDAQTACINTPITNITYATTVATGATVSGLPPGVTGSWNANVFTISGTPLITGTFTYTVTLTGPGLCGGITATGSIVVNGINTMSLSSAAGTDAQTVCISTPIVNITYATTGATGATVSGLPAGVTGVWAADVVTISGTPTVAGSFNYLVTLTGGCGTVTANGSIGVTGNNTIVLSSAAGTDAQTVCVNTPIVNITYTTTGATGATITGLPAGVSGVWSSNVVTISGTPTTFTGSPFGYTITLTGGCGNITATGTLTVLENPTLSNAGADQTICTRPGQTTLTANTPTAGTGAWSQASGPSTATILSINSPTTTVNQLTSTGVYKFVWTISNGVCTPSTDTVEITVNASPALFTVAGGGQYCVGTQILSAPVDPNYAYLWERSLTGLNGTFSVYGATAATQPVTVSGIYRATVTNQFGCTATDTASVAMADWVYNGSLAAGDATQTGRLNRFAAVSTCAAPKACPLTFTTTGSRYYDSYTIVNPRNVPVCATIGLSSGCGTNIFTAAYTGSYNPTALCANYLADPGSSFPGTAFYEATIPANGTIVVVVHEVNPGTGCSNYQLTVDVPRDPSPITVTPASPSCSGVPITLTAPVANTYSWSPGGATTQSIIHNSGTTNYTVTLGYGNNGCTSSLSQSVTVLAPAVNPVTNKVYCNGASASIAFSGGDAGTTYNWTNNNTAIGLGASGTGNLNFTATNTGGSPISATITVTPVNGSCTGTPITFTITVNPIPIVNPQTLAPYCPGAAVTLNFTANTPPAGTQYFWTNSNTAIGLGAGGIGNISFTATNATNAPITATINVTPAYTNGGVTCFGTSVDYIIVINPTPTVNPQTFAPFCPGASVVLNFTGNTPPAQTQYFWTNSNTAIGLVAGGIGNISFTATNTTNAPITGTINVTPSYSNGGTTCFGTPVNFVITVNPTPTVNAIANQIVCNNSGTTAVNFSGTVAGTIYNWTNNTTSIGLAASGTGNIASFTATNATNAPVTATITVTPSYVNGGTTCTGSPQTFTITVNPTPIVNSVANQVLCNNTATAAVNFTSATTGGTIVYNWTNNNTSIGLAASGTGNIASFVATNATNAPAIATITVIPSYTNGGVTCTGTPLLFTITVNPVATINSVANQTICNGGTTTAINFTSPATGGSIVYNWINSTPSIGLAANGIGNIPSFTAINLTLIPVVATITVTPTYTNGGVSCVGTPISFTITVNPTPVVNPVASQVVCNGSPTASINFTTPVSGGTVVYLWTNNTPSIGLPGAGTGNILPFTATNTTNVPVVATLTVTMTYTNAGVTCVSLPVTFTITVNPTPQVNQPADQTLCANATTAPVNFTGTVAGTVYNWTNSTPSIGLAASGSGNIPSFVALNTSNIPVTATIVVTPSYTNGGVTCTGPAKTFNIIVNPLPTVAPVSNKVYCTGVTTLVIPFTGTSTNLPGTVYNWTNSTPAIGLPASGAGDIAPFVTTNTTNGPLVATIVVTPVSATGCVGTSISFTITVNPRPIVNPVASQVVCNGASTAVINFTSPTTGPTGALSFSWVNNTPSIGLAASGTGSILPFTAVNTGVSPITATITVTPVYTNGGITCTGVSQSFTITVNPTPTVNPVANQVLCVGSSTSAVNFTGSVAGTIFSWTNSNPAIGLAASGVGNIASFVPVNTGTTPVVATITVTPVYTNGGITCTGSPISFTITVNPIPSVNPVANQVVCAGAVITQSFSGPVAGTVYNWTNSNTAIGLPASGTGNLNFTTVNTTNAVLTATITVTPSYTNSGGTCIGTPITFTITVNPIPTVNVIASQVLCNGTSTAAVNFTGAVAGTVYSWTNSNTTIGLGASGTGNIGSFTATNTTTVVQVATITVTPTFTNGGVSCTGTPRTFTITVNPTPTVTAIANQTVCNGASTTAVTITGSVAGTVYNWTNNNTSIGLAASGSNIIPSFAAINTGSTPVTATITVTPTFTNGGVSCAGPAITFTITVNPTAVVNQPASQTVCNGASTAAINFTGAVAGTVYNWTNNNTTIGLAASGSGNIPAFAAINSSAVPVTATITVTPTAAGCVGLPVSFTITVNPTPAVNAIANQTLCAGATTVPVVFSGPVAGTVYTWTNSNTSIGLGASGIGNIPAFVSVNTSGSPETATITVTATYTNGGVSCTGPVRTFTITVNPLPNIVFVNVPQRVCLTDTIVTLVASIAGGTWSGPGISGNSFSATAAGAGVHTITYTSTNIYGCTSTRSATITVSDCVERHQVFQNAIRLWPNPNRGRFSIQFNSDIYKEFKVKIIGSNGQEMGYYEFKNLYFGKILPFDLSRLASGQYFLYVYNEKERGVFPFVIVR